MINEVLPIDISELTRQAVLSQTVNDLTGDEKLFFSQIGILPYFELAFDGRMIQGVTFEKYRNERDFRVCFCAIPYLDKGDMVIFVFGNKSQKFRFDAHKVRGQDYTYNYIHVPEQFIAHILDSELLRVSFGRPSTGDCIAYEIEPSIVKQHLTREHYGLFFKYLAWLIHDENKRLGWT